MLKTFFRDKNLLVLLVIAILIKLLSTNSFVVETYYSSAFYPVFAKVYRLLLGWIPISVGDLLYLAGGIYLLSKLIRLFGLIRSKKVKASLTIHLFRKYLTLFLAVYVVFMLFWGLNYSREGIRQQLGLKTPTYTQEELFNFTILVQNRLNYYADQIDSVNRNKYLDNHVLTENAVKAYFLTSNTYPFLVYENRSMKGSFYSFISHYVGFTGYYNPFSAEGQMNTTVPVFLRPFIICHEMAHQIGYAKENEASFVSFLATINSRNPDFLYSTYYELYRTCISELSEKRFKEQLPILKKGLHPRVLRDNKELEIYLRKYRNVIESFISRVYDRYLRLNNQPQGKATYNQVVGLVIAYLRQNGPGVLL